MKVRTAGVRRLTGVGLHAWGAAALLLFVGTPRLLAARDDLDLGRKRVRERALELTPPDKDLPEDALALAIEKQALLAEIADIKSTEFDERKFSEAQVSLSEAERDALAAIEQAKDIQCPAGSSALDALVARLRIAMRRAQPYVLPVDFAKASQMKSEDPISTIIAAYDAKAATPSCEELKKLLSAPDLVDRVHRFTAEIQGLIQERMAAEQDLSEGGKALLGLLQARRRIVDERMSRASAQQNISDRLWLALGIIGLLSIGTILAVRCFSDAIQTEWVASGQVIQFVTVMIILIVIMALGLAGVLRENTLGTLLGGIGGYVLAQGVGRAAAREALRQPNRTD